MTKLVSWIKNNQAKAATIGFLLAALAYTQLSKQNTVEDCLLQVVRDAKTERAASIGRRACYDKFRKAKQDRPAFVNPFSQTPTNRFGGIPVCSETQIYDPFDQTCNDLPKGLSKVPPKN